MNWLLDRGQFTGVMPKTVRHFSLNLADAELSSIAFYTMVVIPGMAALAGLIVWWRGEHEPVERQFCCARLRSPRSPFSPFTSR